MAVKARLERPRFGRRRLELRPEELRRHLDPGRLHFASTAEVEPLVGTIGQPRALDALEFGLAVETRGFNLFVSGLPGSGRLTTVLDYLRALAGAKPVPSRLGLRPRLRQPRPAECRPDAGRPRSGVRQGDGRVRRGGAARDTTRVRERGVRPSAARDRRRDRPGARERRGGADALRRRAQHRPQDHSRRRRVSATRRREAHHARTLRTAVRGTARAITKASAEVEERAAGYIRQVHQLEKEAARRVQELEREVALFATEPLFRELEERYGDQPEVLAYLDSVRTTCWRTSATSATARRRNSPSGSEHARGTSPATA